MSNRVIKLVESANIKLAEVASNALGVSGRAMLRALVPGRRRPREDGRTGAWTAEVKQGQLRRALRGKLTRSQRFVLQELLDQLEQLEAAVARVSAEIREQIEGSGGLFAKDAMELLQTIPGVGEHVAEVIHSAESRLISRAWR